MHEAKEYKYIQDRRFGNRAYEQLAVSTKEQYVRCYNEFALVLIRDALSGDPHKLGYPA